MFNKTYDRFDADRLTAADGILFQGSSEGVQDVLDRASNGDSVYLRSGTFNEGVGITANNLSIIGAGRGTLINGGNSNAITDNYSTGIILKNLAIKTTGNNATALSIDTNGGTQWQVSNIYIEESDYHGMYFGSIGDDSQSIITEVWCNSSKISDNDIRIDADNVIVDDIFGTVSGNGSYTEGETRTA